MRAEPRFTRDVDIAVRVRNGADVEQIGKELLARGYEFVWELEQTRVGRVAGIRFKPPLSDARAVIDLLFASSGIEPEVVEAADATEVFPGVSVPVATAAHLIALKVLSQSDRRLQDAADLQSLLRVASLAELERSKDALSLIQSRGFHRDKDLHAELAEAMLKTGRYGQGLDG